MEPTAVQPGKPAAVKPATTPMKSPAAMSGIGHLWLNNSGSKQQCRCGMPENPSEVRRDPLSVAWFVNHSFRNRAAGPRGSRAQLLPDIRLPFMCASAFGGSNWRIDNLERRFEDFLFCDGQEHG